MRSLGLANWLCLVGIVAGALSGAGCRKQEQKSEPVAASAPAASTAPAPVAEGDLMVVVQDSAARPDGEAKVCVHLQNNSGKVAGMQMDLNWDPSCLRVGEQGAEPACTMNPAAQRSLFRAAIRKPGALRVLFLNLADTNPMPASVSELFCCEFHVAEGASGRSCSFDLANAIASDPQGVRLPIGVRGGRVEIKSGVEG